MWNWNGQWNRATNSRKKMFDENWYEFFAHWTYRFFGLQLVSHKCSFFKQIRVNSSTIKAFVSFDWKSATTTNKVCFFFHFSLFSCSHLWHEKQQLNFERNTIQKCTHFREKNCEIGTKIKYIQREFGYMCTFIRESLWKRSVYII